MWNYHAIITTIEERKGGRNDGYKHELFMNFVSSIMIMMIQ